MFKTGVRLFLVLLAMLAIAACGDDDDTSDSTETQTSSSPVSATSTATTTGSPRATAPAGGAATGTAEEELAETATGEPASPEVTAEATETEEATGAGSPTVEESPVVVPPAATEAQARLYMMLMTVDDLGPEWTETRREAPETDESVTEGALCGVPSFDQRTEKLAEVEAEWVQDEETGPYFLQNIVEFPEDVVESAMDYARESVSCTEWTDEDGQTITVTPIDDPQLAELGDDAVGAVMSIADDSGVTQDIEVIYVRVGTLITAMLYVEINPEDPTTGIPSAVNLARLASEKIEAGL